MIFLTDGARRIDSNSLIYTFTSLSDRSISVGVERREGNIVCFYGWRRKFVYSISFQVSWVRHRDIHLLTVGRYTYTSDQRFEALHLPHAEEWTLRIRYPQKKDSGIYECQISTTPPIGHPVYLTIVGKEEFRLKMEKTLFFSELRKSFFFFFFRKFSKEGPSSIKL